MALHDHSPEDHSQLSVPPLLTRADQAQVPRMSLPDGELAPDVASQLIRDELLLDGSARLNLATFVTTWMEPEARALIDDALDKNLVDKDEYPQTAEMERRCVNILAGLWRADEQSNATGCSTTGSSEACMLGGLALKWRWRERRKAAGAATDKPNLVMGANVQVCWEKFCRYWDVEPRMADVSAEAPYLTGDAAAALCDENTIGVVAILGSTMDGSYEPVSEIAAALDHLQADKGLDVPVHVDAASGGFIAPFCDPELVWDFRLPRVQSINASGHKYGLIYPGVGWVVWRDHEALPEDLVFHVNYLGGDMPTFALNFSRPGAQVVAQYYMFLRLGHEGFRRVQHACRATAQGLSRRVAELGPFELLSHGDHLPVFAFRLADHVDGYTVYDVSDGLRGKGWIVPAYRMPPAIDDMAVLRVCVRNGFTDDLAGLFLEDLERVVKRLDDYGSQVPPADERSSFHH
jgi:glutamate decarboxylase